MNKEQIVDFLALIKAKPSADQARSGWVISSCPLGPWRHDNGKSNPQAFAVRIEQGDSFCNCFSCGFHGNQSFLLEEFRRLNKATPMYEGVQFGTAFDLITAAENDVQLDFGSPGIEELLFAPKDGDDHYVFPEEWLDSFAPAYSMAWSAEYLMKRNVGPIMALTLELKADSKLKRVCCPIRDFKGRLRGLHGRAVDDNAELRYFMYKHKNKKNPIVWLGEAWVDLSKPIVVVEGFFDVASVRRVYSNVVSPLYAHPNAAKIMRMADAMQWITALDRGKGGDAGRNQISKTLKNHLITHLQLTSKDPGAASKDELVAVLCDHVELDAD